MPEDKMLVKELLDKVFVQINPTDSLAEAWAALNEAHITGGVVVTDDGRIVGFVTDGDLIRACMPSEADITIYDEIMEKMDLPPAIIRHLRAMKVEDIMERAENVITINANEPVLKAIALMFQHRLRRIPVIEGNELLGTISRGTILSEILIGRKV